MTEPTKQTADSLLGQLESIKNLLDEQSENPVPVLDKSADIPLLNQAAGEQETDIPTLDLPDIFGDGFEDNHSPETTPITETAIKRPDIEIDLLIQEIVDEYVPALEAELRKRLAAYSPTALRQLADKLKK